MELFQGSIFAMQRLPELPVFFLWDLIKAGPLEAILVILGRRA